MRMKIAMSAITVFFVLSVAFIPGMMLSSVTKVNIEAVHIQTYKSAVYSSGEVIEKNVKEIYLESPVIASSVNVEIGDYVRKGDCLVSIDTELTKTVLSQGVTAKPIGDDLQNVDAGELAAKYGLAEADIQAAMGQYKTAPVKQSDMAFIPQNIFAPISGIVTAVNLQTDVLTQTTKPVLVVSDSSAFAARVSVNEGDVARITPGNEAKLTGVGFNDREYKGTVTKIYPTARKVLTGTAQQTVVDVEISLNEADEALKPGFSVSAVISANDGGEILAVPYAAVQQDADDNREFVYVYNQNRLQKRYIETGAELAEVLSVTEGLKQGERVVTNPADIKKDDCFAYPVKGEGKA